MVIAMATNERGFRNQVWSTRGNPGADLWASGAPGKRLLSWREGEWVAEIVELDAYGS
jgi:hypothetical protein